MSVNNPGRRAVTAEYFEGYVIESSGNAKPLPGSN